MTDPWAVMREHDPEEYARRCDALGRAAAAEAERDEVLARIAAGDYAGHSLLSMKERALRAEAERDAAEAERDALGSAVLKQAKIIDRVRMEVGHQQSLIPDYDETFADGYGDGVEHVTGLILRALDGGDE